MKAPEEDNSSKVARNQSTVRTRAGRTIVYDRGRNLNTIMELKFKDVTDVDRSSLVVFLEAVQWASSKIAYEDMYGDVYYVRAVEENGITYRDQGLVNKSSRLPSRILWNFDLDLLNLTDSITDLDEEDPPVSNALALHIANLDEPHNPTVCATINIADGAVVIEQFSTTTWKSVSWLIVASKAAKKCVFLVTLTHNRNGLTDATIVTTPTLTFLSETSDIYSKLTIAADLNGASTAQVMRMKCTTSEDGIQVCVKRTKM
jgi:hypothetical protein